MNNHIWHGSHNAHEYLRPPSSASEYHPPKTQGIIEGQISAKAKMMAPMLQTNKQESYFTVKKIRKQYKRRGIIRRNRYDSSTTSTDLILRF